MPIPTPTLKPIYVTFSLTSSSDNFPLYSVHTCSACLWFLSGFPRTLYMQQTAHTGAIHTV